MKNSTYRLIVAVLLAVIILGGGYLAWDYWSAQETVSAEETTGMDLAPDFTVEDGAGNTLTLSDLIGQPVVVNFWASWCGPCQREMPHFQTAFEQYGDRVRFVMVNLTTSDTVSDAQAVVDAGGYTFPVYFDTAGACTVPYDLSAIPVTVFINADGSIASRQVGALTESVLLAGIESILSD